jgi:hypothetical protein
MTICALLALQMAFPWMHFIGPEPHSEASPTPKTVPVRVVSDGVASPAEMVVDAVMTTDLSAFKNWDAEPASKTPTTTSLGFGCDPKDGLAPVVSRSRGFAARNGSAAVVISARAYPAGSGSLVLDGIRQAAISCSGASVVPTSVETGVEAVQIASTRLTAILWRQGDVVVSLTSERYSRAGSISAYDSAISSLDKALTTALQGRCTDTDADLDTYRRSPFIARGTYRGYFKSEEVAVPTPGPGYLVAEEREGVVPVSDPPPIIEAPTEVDRPERPNPAPLSDPKNLPRELDFPVAPERPKQPASTTKVARATADTTGPGCGWSFTGQAIPVFDEVMADSRFAKDAAAAQAVMLTKWERWQDAKVAYYAAYADYTSAVTAYRDYATEVAKVKAAWKVINAARQEYYDAYNMWREQADAYDSWTKTHSQAVVDYKAAQDACDAYEAEPSQSPSPTPAPTHTPPSGVLGPSSSPTPTPSATAAPVTEPAPDCPPKRPTILDENAPEVDAEPTPAPEAQLR